MGNKEDAVRMVDNERLRGKGYVVKESVAKRPMLMVYDVGGGVEEKEVLKEMFERNFSESMTENEFLRAVKVRRRIKQRNGRGESDGKESWVMEVNGRIYEESMERARLYLWWEAVKVREYMDVVRCYKCQ